MNEQAVEKAGLSTLIELFNQMGGWPILVGENWNAKNFVWTRAIRNLRAFGVNFDFFFNVTVDVDRENPEKYILGVNFRIFQRILKTKIEKYFVDS